MKYNTYLFCVVFLCFLSLQVSAQESTFPNIEETETEVDNDRERGQYVPVDRERGQYIPSGEPVRNGVNNDVSDVPASVPSTSKSAPANNEKQGAKEEETDSVLGFNFLYYIIQKFKMSDIVDR